MIVSFDEKWYCKYDNNYLMKLSALQIIHAYFTCTLSFCLSFPPFVLPSPLLLLGYIFLKWWQFLLILHLLFLSKLNCFTIQILYLGILLCVLMSGLYCLMKRDRERERGGIRKKNTERRKEEERNRETKETKRQREGEQKFTKIHNKPSHTLVWSFIIVAYSKIWFSRAVILSFPSTSSLSLWSSSASFSCTSPLSSSTIPSNSLNLSSPTESADNWNSISPAPNHTHHLR